MATAPKTLDLKISKLNRRWLRRAVIIASYVPVAFLGVLFGVGAVIIIAAVDIAYHAVRIATVWTIRSIKLVIAQQIILGRSAARVWSL